MVFHSRLYLLSVEWHSFDPSTDKAGGMESEDEGYLGK